MITAGKIANTLKMKTASLRTIVLNFRRKGSVAQISGIVVIERLLG
jgi:hypothetical protein